MTEIETTLLTSRFVDISWPSSSRGGQRLSGQNNGRIN